jgi:Tfp pilus assembly protein PilE
MPTRTPRAPTPRRGSTLVELIVVVCITGVLASMAVPSFRRAVEQAKADQAAATLRTIWAAQRFYRLDHDRYATQLDVLVNEGLMEPVNEAIGGAASDEPYHYELADVGEDDFQVVATRQGRGSGTWKGNLILDETGHFPCEIKSALRCKDGHCKRGCNNGSGCGSCRIKSDSEDPKPDELIRPSVFFYLSRE